jgi:hypothetical protein
MNGIHLAFVLIFTHQFVTAISNKQLVVENDQCGGDVFLSPENESFIQYKLDTNYNNERCEWFLKPVETTKLYTVTLRLLDHGFTGRDTGIALYSLDPWRSNLSAYAIAALEDYEIVLYDFTMLRFEANNFYAGKGFRVSLTLKVREEVRPAFPSASTHLLTTWSDYLKYPVNDPTYKPNERVYIVISPPNPYYQKVRLYLDNLDIQWCGDNCECDWLDVYRLTKISEYSRVTRLCGIGPNATEHIISQNYEPYLLVLHSDNNSTVGSGFQVSWCQSQ